MHTVTLMDAGVRLNYPCVKCGEYFDARQELDDHLVARHRQVWRGFGK